MRPAELVYPASLRMMSEPPPCCGRAGAAQRGFTMVELVIVMVLIGVLGAIGAARFFDRKSFDTVEFTDQTKAMLRYAQKVAIAQNRPVFVRLNGTSVALCFDATCSAGNRVLAPVGTNSGSSVTLANCVVTTWSCEGVPSGVSYGTTPATSTLFYFDPLGKPYAATDTWPVVNSTFTSLLIRVTGDGANHDITVEPETGYVH